jgi:hypothetical protein
VRRVTRIGQKLSGHLKKVQGDCAQAMRNRMAIGGTLHGMPLKYFINMDQTAVYFEMKSSTTFYKKGERTVSVCDSTSYSKKALLSLQLQRTEQSCRRSSFSKVSTTVLFFFVNK